MNPLRKVLIPVAISLFAVWILWLLLAPIFQYVGWFLPFFAVGIGIGIFLWRYPTGRLQEFLKNPAAKKVGMAVAITAVAGAIWLFTGWLVGGYLSPNMNLTIRGAFILIAVLLPWMAVSVVTLYKPVGISDDAANAITGGFKWARWIIILIVLTSTTLLPDIYFDRDTGKAKFMYAEHEEKIYWVQPEYKLDKKTGETLLVKKYSPATQEQLIPGTPEIAKRFAWGSQIEKIWSGVKKSFKSKKPPPPRVPKEIESEEEDEEDILEDLPDIPGDIPDEKWEEPDKEREEPYEKWKEPRQTLPEKSSPPKRAKRRAQKNWSGEETIKWAEKRIDQALSSDKELEICKKDPDCLRAKRILENSLY
ncbi:MAG: hypothetical protein COU46_02275 [Candidatus Niyogibacteria bacterium CG10_big_fil_rev_8_21_14_0_10_42_19]|uniref:Uncharacterized protein n=1 Tax=Candidatus Niyogibacteria bacterium CG10_big_fil_rev_8_21_14_0_10_42_19 TaxID=1974725 RepID=A0A2H0TFH3_9BACT|nr:MAG: hypothetical protein COU46_02275 [Candidatus Niyogibacteria bacterium CG10_big_fil_rev_8_21_14_0_10_42_19]